MRIVRWMAWLDYRDAMLGRDRMPGWATRTYYRNLVLGLADTGTITFGRANRLIKEAA